jgi:cyclophilin family peptidyl-prolyl cis-trans isomerase
MILPFQRFLSALVLATSLTLAVSQGPSQSQSADPIVVMQTTKGTMAIRVYANMVPTTARNFLDLVSRGFYDGKSFHRIETWCIQGGDPNGNGSGSFVDPNTGQTRYIPLEINNKLGHYAPGVVAMARSDNPNSASCQFYILKKAMPQLNGQYAIFGGVVNGLNTIYSIQRGDRIIHAEIVNQGQSGGQGSSASGSQPTTTQPTGQSGF